MAVVRPPFDIHLVRRVISSDNAAQKATREHLKKGKHQSIGANLDCFAATWDVRKSCPFQGLG